jgi:hypothetical protein
MIDTIVGLSGIFASMAIGAGVYYKLGRVEQKLAFLYENCDIEVRFHSRNGNQEVKRNGTNGYKIRRRN